MKAFTWLLVNLFSVGMLLSFLNFLAFPPIYTPYSFVSETHVKWMLKLSHNKQRPEASTYLPFLPFYEIVVVIWLPLFFSFMWNKEDYILQPVGFYWRLILGLIAGKNLKMEAKSSWVLRIYLENKSLNKSESICLNAGQGQTQRESCRGNGELSV